MFDFWNQKHVLQSLTDSLVFKTWTRLILCKLKCYILFRVEKLRKKMKLKKLYTSLQSQQGCNKYIYISRFKVDGGEHEEVYLFTKTIILHEINLHEAPPPSSRGVLFNLDIQP